MKNYTPLYAIQLCYSFAVAILSIALIGMVFNNGGSVAVLMIFMALPSLLFSRMIGGLLDKYNMKKVFAFAMLSELLLISVMILGGLLSYNIFIYIFAFMSFTTTIFIELLLQISITQLTQEKHYLKMNSVMSLIENIGVVSGPVLGGYFIYQSNIIGILILASFLYTAILFSAFFLKTPSIDDEETHLDKGDSSEPKATKTAKKHRIKEVFYAVALFGFAISIINTTQIAFVIGRYNTNEFGYGLTESAWGMGMAIGASIVFLLSKRLRPYSIFGYSYVLIGMAILLLFISYSFPFALILFLVIGIGNIMVAIVSTTLIQKMSPIGILGKNLGMKTIIFQASTLLSMTIVGFLDWIISPLWFFTFSGIIFLLGGLSILLFLILRKADQDI